MGHLVTRTGEAVTTTRYGRPEAVLVSAEAYEELRQLRRDRDRRRVTELAAADERGETTWTRSPARSRQELVDGLGDALDL